MDMPDYSKLPPVGLQPRVLFYEDRLKDIKEAIERRLEAGYPIPVDWVIEYNELTL